MLIAGTTDTMSCGKGPTQSMDQIRYRATLFVVGGREATSHSWPWQCALLKRSFLTCGCSIVAPDWVITAAHCKYVSL